MEVENSGKRAGDEVVQLYIKCPQVVRELQGFRRVSLGAGERKTVEFALTHTGAGAIEIMVGGLKKTCLLHR